MKPFIPSRLAELIFALIIGFFGVSHFTSTDSMAAYVPDFIPGDSKIWVYITGAGHLLAALSIIIGKLKTAGSYFLAFMLLVFATTIHLRGLLNTTDEEMKAIFMTNMLKDTAMAMCAILIGNRVSRKSSNQTI